MRAAFYAGATGLMAHQEAMNVVGHNLANVNTSGYKPQSQTFEQLLYTEMYANTPLEANHGGGVRSTSNGIIFGQSAFQRTDEPLSFGIMGDGFFALQDADGNVSYSRDGTFALSLEGGDPYLVATDGAHVLDADGEAVRVEELEDTEGALDYNALVEAIGVYRFSNPNALDAVSLSRYVPTAKSGEAQVSEGELNQVLQGYIENSGTDVTTEMTNLIVSQRSYQLSARVVQAADEVEQVVANLRG